MHDHLGAFCAHVELRISGAEEGALAGLEFAAKDLFDVAGYVACCGNPDWLLTHEPAASTAPAVQTVLGAGATLVGKTQTDELAYSLLGQNSHYGTPLNPRAPDRVPGGSSSGSASAVAGELVDFALGTDTGGSVRIPASNCGVFGFRPTHGRISLAGIMPLAPSFDTVGWFTMDAELLERVGGVFLGDAREPSRPSRLLLAEDAFALADEAVRQALGPAAEAAVSLLGPAETITVAAEGLGEWMQCFRILQGREIHRCHGEWIQQVGPSFGDGVRERFEWTATITDGEVRAALEARERVAARLESLLRDQALLCLPTAPSVAPLKSASAADLEGYRGRTLSLTCIAGLARLPQVSFPAGFVEGAPIGLSLLGARGSDSALLRLASRLAG